MKTYKYYVHGKPKTFDLTNLSKKELEDFKNMNNTERLKFIELHHLEDKPLWDEIDIKTSTKLTDEALNNEKNYKKYYNLYVNQNIKNQLERKKDKINEAIEDYFKDRPANEIKDDERKRVFKDTLKENLSDNVYKDVEKTIEEGYTNIDSLINYYINKIETLNVDSIDTLKAKEIANLEASNITKISIGLDGLKSVADTYKTIEEELAKHSNPEEKKSIIKSIISDEEFIKQLTDKTAKALNVSVSKEDLKEILNDSGLIKEVVKEVQDKVKIFDDVYKKMNDTIIKAVNDFSKKAITEEQLKNILKTELKTNDDEKISQLITDFGTLKGMVEDIKKDNEAFKGTIDNVNRVIEDVNNKLKDIDKKGLNYNDMLKTILIPLDDFIDDYGYNKKTNSRDYRTYKDETKINFPPHKTKEAISSKDKQFENIMKNLDKYITIIKNYDNLPEPTSDTNRINQTVREGNRFIKYAYNVLSNFDEFNNYGEGIEKQSFSDQRDEDFEGGKFLNRFKDFEPDINKLENRLNNKIEKLENKIKQLEDKMIYKQEEHKQEHKDEEHKTKEKDYKPSFLDDIIKQPTLKPTETKTYKPIDENQRFSDQRDEHEDIKEILRRRREDMEPDDEESESEEWGEGFKQKDKGTQAQDKIIKFRALMKLLK